MRLTDLTAAGFSVLVLAPLRLAHRVLGDRTWPLAERLAALAGAGFGAVTNGIARRVAPGASPLEVLLTATDVVEGSLGIRGENKVLDDFTAHRRVDHCPFADKLTALPEFCTRLGYLAGCEGFERMVPGCRFEILCTKSQGHRHCEYVYRVPASQASRDRRQA